MVEVDGVPQRDRVEDQAERAELVFHAFAVAVAQLALTAVKHRAREVVTFDAPSDSHQPTVPSYRLIDAPDQEEDH